MKKLIFQKGHYFLLSDRTKISFGLYLYICVTFLFYEKISMKKLIFQKGHYFLLGDRTKISFVL